MVAMIAGAAKLATMGGSQGSARLLESHSGRELYCNTTLLYVVTDLDNLHEPSFVDIYYIGSGNAGNIFFIR
jgi:hypothetical protein